VVLVLSKAAFREDVLDSRNLAVTGRPPKKNQPYGRIERPFARCRLSWGVLEFMYLSEQESLGDIRASACPSEARSRWFWSLIWGISVLCLIWVLEKAPSGRGGTLHMNVPEQNSLSQIHTPRDEDS
jgi:hypothetical protein